MAQDTDDDEILEATPEEQAFLMSVLAVRASEYGRGIHALEAENDRLRKALRRLSSALPMGGQSGLPFDEIGARRAFAAAALLAP